MAHATPISPSRLLSADNNSAGIGGFLASAPRVPEGRHSPHLLSADNKEGLQQMLSADNKSRHVRTICTLTVRASFDVPDAHNNTHLLSADNIVSGGGRQGRALGVAAAVLAKWRAAATRSPCHE